MTAGPWQVSGATSVRRGATAAWVAGAATGLHRARRRAYSLRMARFLILTGVALVVIGLLWGPLSKLGLGRLPGDISIQRGNVTLYIPVTSAVLVSAVLSVAIWAVRLFLGR